jgi:RNA polymerase sigma-70 factor (ECF subfamily)
MHLHLTLHRKLYSELIKKFPITIQKKTFAPWIFTIARNLALNSLKRSKRKAEVSMDESFTESNPRTENDHEIGIVWEKAKQILSKTAHASLRLHYGEELTINEVSKIMGKSEIAIKVILHRSRKKLAKYFKSNPIKL